MEGRRAGQAETRTRRVPAVGRRRARSILDELSQLAKEDAAAREKEAKRQARYNRQVSRLLLRGKGLFRSSRWPTL